jgi:hypothetical protein
MERYSFSEIKSFSSGDIFWAKNDNTNYSWEKEF